MNMNEVLPPVALRGFEQFRPFWEPRWNKYAVKVAPGQFYVSNSDMVITTVLGSCISACIHDPVTKFGGLNHFMLPSSGGSEDMNRSMRYGFFAMEQLINEILKRGGTKERLEVKLFGGGNVIKTATQIGTKNINFARGYLRDEEVTIIGEDVGGTSPRKVRYQPATGRAWVLRLRREEDFANVEQEEARYKRRFVPENPVEDDVELF